MSAKCQHKEESNSSSDPTLCFKCCEDITDRQDPSTLPRRKETILILYPRSAYFRQCRGLISPPGRVDNRVPNSDLCNLYSFSTTVSCPLPAYKVAGTFWRTATSRAVNVPQRHEPCLQSARCSASFRFPMLCHQWSLSRFSWMESSRHLRNVTTT